MVGMARQERVVIVLILRRRRGRRVLVGWMSMRNTKSMASRGVEWWVFCFSMCGSYDLSSDMLRSHFQVAEIDAGGDALIRNLMKRSEMVDSDVRHIHSCAVSYAC